MSDSPRARSVRIGVVGAGIAGLAAAHRVRELDPGASVAVFERGERAGGVIGTQIEGGFLVERSADSFITNVPWGIDLCRRIGLEKELVETDRRYRRAFVVRRGKLAPVPEGFLLMQPKRFWPLVTTRLLSPWGKVRLAWERMVPSRQPGGRRELVDESLASFARRRLGKEAYERLVQPLVGGIYTADPERLSLAATLPRFLEMERDYGSLIRAATRQPKERGGGGDSPIDTAARYGMFLAPRGGLKQLIGALVERLPEGGVRLGNAVERVERLPSGEWRVFAAGGAARGGGSPAITAGEMTFDQVILATPAPVTAELLRGVDGELAGHLASIEQAGSTIACLGYRREQIEHRLDGFGFVVPAIEGRRILAGSFSSVKFPGRAPEGQVLLRVFLGGATQPEWGELSDGETLRVVAEELGELLGVRGNPCLTLITRWKGAMPQYHLGHLERVAAIESRVGEWPGLHLAGNAYHGVGIPYCIRSGELAAERAVAAAGGR